jgi:hypothetical protein
MNIPNHLNIAIVCSVLLVPLAAAAEPSILSGRPETRAIEAFLLGKGNRKLIEETRGTKGGTDGDEFGRYDLLTGPVNAPKKIRFYVFKEAGQWVAYDKLPAHKDSLYVFVELATEYLTKKKGEWTGASVADDTWKSKHQSQRVINFRYDEAGKGVPIALTFTFTEKEGWHITAANPEPKATSKSIP